MIGNILTNPANISSFQDRLHTSMPGRKTSAVLSHAPGKIVPGDAAATLLSLSIDTLVCDNLSHAALLQYSVFPSKGSVNSWLGMSIQSRDVPGICAAMG